MNVTAAFTGLAIVLTLLTVEPPTSPQALATPILVTALGPANARAAYELFWSLNVDFTMNEIHKSVPNLARYRTLVVVPGFDRDSIEGEEDDARDVTRMRVLMAQAKRAKIPILLLHIGGRDSRTPANPRSSNRADNSNRPAVDSADRVIVTAPGNEDGFFTSRASRRGIPVEVVAGIPEAGAELVRLFGAGLRTSTGSIGSLVPPLTTSRTPSGSTFQFASLRERWAVLHFWTTASSELRTLRPYQAKYGDRAHFVGVAVDSYEWQWKRAVAGLPANWTHVLNGKGDADLARLFGVQMLPTWLLIDPSGRIVARDAEGSPDFFRTVEGRLGPKIR